MDENAKNNKLFKWLAIFTIFPVIATLIMPVISFHSIENIPGGDLFIIFIFPIFFIVIFSKLFLTIRSKPTHEDIMIFVAFIIIFSMGWGMHSTMNTVDVFSFRRGVTRIIDEDVRQMIWFFDEILGHFLIYIGYYGLMLQFCFLEKGIPENPVKKGMLIIALFGFLWGVGMSGGIVEAGFTLFILPINGLSLLLIYYLIRKNGETAKMFLQKHPFILFYVTQTLTVIPLIMIYFIFFSLKQPSEMLSPILVKLYGD